MKRTPAETVVESLKYASDPRDAIIALQGLNPKQWHRVLTWLDDAGLAFYFLDKLRRTETTDRVPAFVVSQLQANFAANQERTRDMAKRFGSLNAAFEDAGVGFAVLKGLSLVPEFCPSADLRYQGDFDYLVDEHSVISARQVLLRAGYREQASSSREEFMFIFPGTAERSRGAAQYSARSPHAVELHLDIWDQSCVGVNLGARLFSVDQCVTCQWNGIAFPALTDEDAFLLQILHACHHLFTQWIRMSCLLEIGHFLHHRHSDATLWARIEHRVGDNRLLRELVVIISEMAGAIFAASLPSLIRNWGSNVRPQVRVWIDRYARDWAFSEFPVHQFSLFPGTRLIQFLHEQYTGGRVALSGAVRHSRLSRMRRDVRHNPSVLLNRAWWRRHLLLRRSLFHALAGLRYVWEIPRWRWLNRTHVRVATGI